MKIGTHTRELLRERKFRKALVHFFIDNGYFRNVNRFKIGEGWQLCYEPKKNRYYLTKSTATTDFTKGSNYTVFQSLFEKGVIKFDYSDKGIFVYQLTEKYRQ